MLNKLSPEGRLVGLRLAAVPPTLQPLAAAHSALTELAQGVIFTQVRLRAHTNPGSLWAFAELLVPVIADQPQLQGWHSSAPAQCYLVVMECHHCTMDEVFLTVRAKPNSSRNRVGGTYGQALIVSVCAPAVDGRASQAVIELVADALGVPRRAIRIKSGHQARTKILGITVEPGLVGQLSEQIAALMAEIGAP